MKRRKAREYAVQILFQHDFTGTRPDIDAFFEDKKEDREVISFASDIVRGALGHLEEIDLAIKAAAEHWDIGRMGAVDRNIIRAAAYEILYRKDIPPAVTINEALEIAKKFSAQESAPFINGILDKISRSASAMDKTAGKQ